MGGQGFAQKTQPARLSQLPGHGLGKAANLDFIGSQPLLGVRGFHAFSVKTADPC